MQLASEAWQSLIKYRASPLWESSLVSQLPFRMWNPGYDLSRWATSAYCGDAAVSEIHKSPEKGIQAVSMVEWIQMHSTSHIWICVCVWFFFSTTGRSTLNNREVTPVPLLIFDCWAFSEGTLVQYFSWSIFERGRGCMEARKILNMKHWPSLSLMKAKFLRSPRYFLRCLKKRWFHNADLKELFHISSLILNLF